MPTQPTWETSIISPFGPSYLVSTFWCRGAALTSVQGLVHRGHLAGACRRQTGLDLFQALDLEPDVVDAFPVLAALAGHVVVLEVQDGHVHVAVAQHEALGVVAFQRCHLP